MSKQLGAAHPKTRAAHISYMMALCDQGEFLKPISLWRERAKRTGLMYNVGLLLDLTFQFCNQHCLGIVLLAILAALPVVAGLLLALRLSMLLSWPWLACFVPLWVLQGTHLAAVGRFGTTCVDIASIQTDEEAEISDRGRELDTSSFEVNVVLILCSFLFALRRDGVDIAFLLVGMPWLALELHWIAMEWRRLGCWVQPTWHQLLRVVSVLWLCLWADGHLPWAWFLVAIPPLLIVFVSLAILVMGLIREGTVSPTDSVITTSRSELLWDVGRAFLALMYTALVVGSLYTSEVENEPALLLLPLLGLALMPAVALATLKLHGLLQWLAQLIYA